MNPVNASSLNEKMVRENFALVRERAALAAERAGRNVQDVRIVGVTKYVSAEVASWLVAAGCLDLGESRPQLIWSKAMEMQGAGVRWHLIGHLQRNKAKKTLPFLSMMHTLDSQRLLDQLELDAVLDRPALPVLLEINVSGDKDKTGMTVADAEQLLSSWQSRSAAASPIEIAGLMGMGALDGGVERARRDFSALRELRDRWSKDFGLPLKELSMGMSGDFEVAIEEGATIVRVGSILFQPSSPA
jgi:pyridoxal phosphate enzyme (YggS family)